AGPGWDGDRRSHQAPYYCRRPNERNSPHPRARQTPAREYQPRRRPPALRAPSAMVLLIIFIIFALGGSGLGIVGRQRFEPVSVKRDADPGPSPGPVE